MYYLSQDLFFPDVTLTHSSGIIALGGDLSARTIAISL